MNVKPLTRLLPSFILVKADQAQSLALNTTLNMATALLQKGDKKLFEVAKSVGYDSDAAFSKAFKRIVGVPPSAYRRSASALQRNPQR
jgi:AraC-like DNA-binding protein